MSENYIREYTQLTSQEYRQLHWKRVYKQEHSQWDDSMVLLRNVTEHNLPPTPCRVLDIGCGNGNFVIDELRDRFSDVIGVDMDTNAVTKNKTCNEVVLYDGHALPFPNNSFDVVLSLWVLEHIRDPKEFFAEVSRVLRPGGFFGFVTPNKRSALVGVRRLLHSSISNKLVTWLYGREEEDIFPVLYRVNSLEDITRFAKKVNLTPSYLLENPDPTYTSFGKVSYYLSALFSSLSISFVKPHIVGILKK